MVEKSSKRLLRPAYPATQLFAKENPAEGIGADTVLGSKHANDIPSERSERVFKDIQKLRKCRERREQMIRESLYMLMATPTRNRIGPVPDDGYKSAATSRDNSPRRSIFTRYPDYSNMATTQRERTSRTISNSRESNPSYLKEHGEATRLNVNRQSERNGEDTKTRARSQSAERDSAGSRASSKSGGSKTSAGRQTKNRRRTKSAGTATITNYSDEAGLVDEFSQSLNLSDLRRLKSHHGTHIRNRSLRKSLGVSASTRVTEQDEKILAAMHRKREQQLENEIRRERAQLQWEEEKLALDRQRSLEEIHRRQVLAARIVGSEEERAEIKRRQLIKEQSMREKLRESVEQNEKKWAETANRQRMRLHQEINERRRRSHQRKKSQEQNRRDSERARTEVVMSELERSQALVDRACMKKNNHIITEQMSRKRMNESELERRDRKQRELQRLSEQRKNDLKCSIESREEQSRKNLEAIAHSRDYNLTLSAKTRTKKMEESRRRIEEMEAELQEWNSTNDRLRKSKAESAAMTSAQLTEMRAVMAAAERANRERQQIATYNIIQEQAAEQREQQKGMIAMKDAKMRQVEDHKIRVLEQVRGLSAISQRMREDMRKKLGSDSFDKKALNVKLESRVGEGHRSATKNRSNLILA